MPIHLSVCVISKYSWPGDSRHTLQNMSMLNKDAIEVRAGLDLLKIDYI
jgi:hypothetical protein